VTTSIALFTRDLRVHDNPVLTAAAAGEHVVPLFVLDDTIAAGSFAARPRADFLADTLADLDTALRGLGARLVIRRGTPVEQVCRLADEVDAAEVHIAADVSRYARSRQTRLADALAGSRRTLHCHEEVVTAIAPGRILPSSKDADHFAVFSPYFRRWSDTPLRDVLDRPRRLRLPELPDPDEPVVGAAVGPHGWLGGETEGRRRARHWLTHDLADYQDNHDDLAGDDTSRLSPYLHFGCVSPVELVGRAAAEPGPGAAAFVRQLAWRDFHHQVLAARPEVARLDYRPRGDRWRTDEQALTAWRTGHTGVPIVDAGMRQLLAQGWMHNRARLITASFLSKTLYLDWRVGAQHFFDHLLDGDIANNCLNWQWVAGTGTDSRPNRVLNPLRQAERYDPDGAYVRRWVPELADLTAPDVHQPWRLGAAELTRRDYPPPIVDIDRARARFQEARQLRLAL
jgi:deoxyribodipyrimidine photo-lyase